MLYVFHRDPHLQIPGWVDVLVFGYLAKLLRINFPREKRESDKLNGNMSVGFQSNIRLRDSYVSLCQRNSNESTKNECSCNPKSSEKEVLCVSCVVGKKLDNLSAKLDSISEQLSQDDILEERKIRWQQLAQILDSLFFWMFVLTMTTSTVSFIFLIPRS